MVYFLGLVQFVLILYITLFEFNNKSSSTFLWATLLLMFGLMNLITCFTGDNIYNSDVLTEASIFVILFCFVYLMVRLLFKKKIIENKKMLNFENIKLGLSSSKRKDIILVLIFILVVIIKLVPVVRYSGNILNTSWGHGRDYSANLPYANLHQVCNIIIYSLSGLITIYFIQKRKKIAIFTILIILFEVIITRNRIEILPVLCSIITIYMLKSEKINNKTIFIGIIGSFFTIYLVYGLRVFRHYGTISNFILNFRFKDFSNIIFNYLKTGNGELGLLRDFYYFISLNNNFPGFGKLATYIRMFLIYIPTNWSFGLKPNDFAITMGSAIGMASGGSTHPTLFGDCFANLGFAGFLLGAFWAMYVNIADNLVLKCKTYNVKILIFVLNAVVYVIIGRGSVYNGFWYVAYGIPFILVSKIFLNSFFKKRL